MHVQIYCFATVLITLKREDAICSAIQNKLESSE